MKTHQEKTDSSVTEELALGLMDENQVDEPLEFKWVDLPVMILFWSLMFIVFLQFFTRYVLNDSLGWTEEIARFLLILVGFVGSVTAVRTGAHIFLEFIYRFIPAKLAKVFVVLSELISVGFYSACCWMSAQIAMQTNQTLVSIEIPKSYIYWIVCICFALMVCYSLGWLLHKLKLTGEGIIAELEKNIAEKG